MSTGAAAVQLLSKAILSKCVGYLDVSNRGKKRFSLFDFFVYYTNN